MASEALLATHLLARLFQLHDRKDFEAEVACFTDGGSWKLKSDLLLEGRAAILGRVSGRSATLETIHVVSNVVVESNASECLRASFYLKVYASDPGEVRRPAPLQAYGIVLGRVEIARDASELWAIQLLDTSNWAMTADAAKAG
ncbi:SnoaL-like domain-containing protein [Bosea sp. OK403]|nr:SnoaL-like domain-containing protein [Bosea sp. OK403]